MKNLHFNGSVGLGYANGGLVVIDLDLFNLRITQRLICLQDRSIKDLIEIDDHRILALTY